MVLALEEKMVDRTCGVKVLLKNLISLDASRQNVSPVQLNNNGRPKKSCY